LELGDGGGGFIWDGGGFGIHGGNKVFEDGYRAPNFLGIVEEFVEIAGECMIEFIGI